MTTTSSTGGKKSGNPDQPNKDGGSKSRKTGGGAGVSSLVDVTAEYEAEEGAGDYVCGVCCAWEPPEDLAGVLTGKKPAITEWIGCDCDRSVFQTYFEQTTICFPFIIIFDH